MKPELETLARKVGEYVDSIGDQESAVAAVRQRLRESGYQASNRIAPRRASLVWAAALVALLAAGGAATWALNAQEPLTAWVEAVDVPLDGRSITTGEEMKQLRFSDGTELSLHPHTSVNVREPSSRGALIVLERGRTLARVQNSGSADYRFLAGPFAVRVTGTAFDVGWSKDELVFELALHEGSVLLEGPTLIEPRVVKRGEFVRIQLGGAASGGQPASPQPSSAAPSADEGAPPEPSREDAPTEQLVPSPARPASEWRDLLARDDATSRQAALQMIERGGSSAVLGTATQSELWRIAEVARLGAHPRLAATALETLRRRFGEKGASAYLLGKIHVDQLRSPSAGSHWFETYLKEAPGGPMAEGALGRLVELRAGTAQGRALAERYVAAYPSGAYANFARAQLAADSGSRRAPKRP